MPPMNIKRLESVPGQGIAKLKRGDQKTVYSILKSQEAVFRDL